MSVRDLLRAKCIMILMASATIPLSAPCLLAAPQQSAEAAVVAAPHVSEPAEPGVPRLIQFNGTLKDAAGRSASGVASVTFPIYNEQDNGTALWSETQNVLADANGHYSVLLGSATANGVPAELFGTGESRWLGVTVARQPETPRVLMASVPYALKAGDSDTLGGLPASSYVTTQQLAARTSAPAVGSTIIATPGVATAEASQSATTDAAQSVIQANPTGSGTTDYVPLWTSGSNLGNSLLFQTGGKLGIGTTTPASTLDINGGEILRGGFYEYPQGTATASTGQPSHSFQWIASLFSTTTNAPVNLGLGFRAVPVGNDTLNPAATLDLFSGTGGPTGSLVDTGLSIDGHGIITFVPGQTFGSSSPNFTSISLPALVPGSGQIEIGGQPFIWTDGNDSSVYMGMGAAQGANATYSPSGSQNVAIGSLAMLSVTTGGNNTAVGATSLFQLQDGTNNTAIGESALTDNQHGSANFAGGYFALSQATGNGNTAVGYLADLGVTSGSYNTALGYYANVGSTSGTISNSTAIGNNATMTESDAIVLGNSTLIDGITPPPNVGIGTPAPRSTLEVSSPVASTFAAPGPILTLSNASSSTPNAVAIDFDPASPAGSLPFARIEATGQSTGASLSFFANSNGSGSGGTLNQTMYIDALGNVQISGSLFVNGEVEKGSGTFRIDDPIDPANKYLSHSFVESPDMMNIYNGNVVTDANGVATVEMPAWFEALNADFRYQLTVLGQFAQAIVASEMQAGKFTIRTDKPNVKVSWQVTGIRHDPYAVAHRTPVEESKPASEQGRYLHPDVYGAGPDQRVRNAQARATSPAASDASLSPSPEAAVTR
jgi:trimeric autotransporter adhesin